MPAAPDSSTVFELKSATLPLVAVVLKTTDLARLAAAFDERFAGGPALFDNEPVAVDLSAVKRARDAIDFEALLALLRGHRMLPIAAKGGSAKQMQEALAAGLVEAHGAAARGPSGPPEPPSPAVVRDRSSASASDAARLSGPEAASAAAGRGLQSPAPGGGSPTSWEREQAAAPSTAGPAPATAPAPTVSRPALVIDKPLRSGQLVHAKGADLIMLAIVSHGAEVIADGNIHVYAPLRGRALAGARGDTSARIFTTCLEPQLVSIAGLYRTAETELPPEVRGRAAQVRLDGERLVVEPLQLD